MASSFLILLDDITAMLKHVSSVSKDVGVITQSAMKKTAGVLGDDLALNAEQVSGVYAQRELPVVKAVFIGSIWNKIILIPIALLLNFYLPSVFMALLMLGGAYLAYEGAHAVIEKFFHKNENNEREQKHIAALSDQNVDMVAFEKEKIRNAIKTDFILSAEIIAIALSAMENYPMLTKVIALSVTVLLITVVVYGLVALLVRFDDIGLAMKQKSNKLLQKIGHALIVSVPYIMSSLSWFGMVALFMVGGGILLHGVPVLAHGIENFAVANFGANWGKFTVMLLSETVFAFIIGFVIVGIETIFNKIRKK